MATKIQLGHPTASSIRQTERLLNIAEVAQLLNVPVSWVYGRTRRRTLDRIPGFRLGKYWRFREADVLTWIERMGTKNA
jgi:excisionase family DNA binding protein